MKLKYIFLTLLFFITNSTLAGNMQPTAVVYLLTRGENPKAIGEYVERLFNHRYSILNKQVLDTQGVVQFREQVKPIVSSEPSGNFCGHEPGFAITIFQKNAVIYEASYCFKCDTIGKATKDGWVRLAMSGSPDEKEKAKAYLISLFE